MTEYEGHSKFQGQKVTKWTFLIQFQRVIPLFHMKFQEGSNGYDGLAPHRDLQEMKVTVDFKVKRSQKMLISGPISTCNTTISHEIS